MNATPINSPNLAGPGLTPDAPDNESGHDIISGPFAVIECDPDVFTTLVRTLGAQGLQVVEPWHQNTSTLSTTWSSVSHGEI